jgi:hypothetical protein
MKLEVFDHADSVARAADDPREAGTTPRKA